jgi:hypothetical protein
MMSALTHQQEVIGIEMQLAQADACSVTVSLASVVMTTSLPTSGGLVVCAPASGQSMPPSDAVDPSLGLLATPSRKRQSQRYLRMLAAC